MPGEGKPTIILESGLAGSPLIWSPVAQLLDRDFRVILHRRSPQGNAALPHLARQLQAALQRSQIPPPYLLAGHSFGALVIRQFAALYPQSTAGLLFIDGLPPTTHIPLHRIAAAIAVARTAELLAILHLLRPLLPYLESRMPAVNWALQELRKLPANLQPKVLKEYLLPGFYASLARMLTALPANLRIARTLPNHIPTLSLHSDYPDPTGARVEQSGHWIQVDQPAAVAAAARKLHAIIRQKGV